MNGQKIIQTSDAKCKSLAFDAPVDLLASDDDKQKEFTIKAYTGAVVDRWWGKLAIALEGIKAKQKIPIFMGHDQSKIVGYSLKTWADDSFNVSGRFSNVTVTSEEVRSLAGEGFPWQASIGVRPTQIVQLEQNGSMKVNGKNVKGPAEVWLESEVYETSFVPLGADGNTKIDVFSRVEEMAQGSNVDVSEDFNMAEDKITIDILAKDAPDLLEQIKSEVRAEGFAAGKEEGAKTERERIQAVKECGMPGHEEAVEKMMWDGKTTGQEAAVTILKAEKLARENLMKDHDKDAPAPVPGQHSVNEDLKIPENATLEDRCKAKWAKDASLRKDFVEFEDYMAYEDQREKGLMKHTARI